MLEHRPTAHFLTRFFDALPAINGKSPEVRRRALELRGRCPKCEKKKYDCRCGTLFEGAKP
jgi:hypothetical protein